MAFTGQAQYVGQEKSSILSDISYDNIEKVLMRYLILNSGELYTFNVIYNAFIKDEFSFVKDPQLLKLLRDRLGAIMQYIDINQKNTTVVYNDKITYEYKYMVGYDIQSKDLFIPSDAYIYIYNSAKHETPTERDIFNVTVDDNLIAGLGRQTLVGDGLEHKPFLKAGLGRQPPVKEACNSKKDACINLLNQGIKFKDFDRVKTIIQRYNLSLCDTIFDNTFIETESFNINIMLIVLNEQNKEIQKLNKKLNLISNNLHSNFYRNLCIVITIVIAIIIAVKFNLI